MVGDLVRDRAEQEALRAGHALVAPTSSKVAPTALGIPTASRTAWVAVSEPSVPTRSAPPSGPLTIAIIATLALLAGCGSSRGLAQAKGPTAHEGAGKRSAPASRTVRSAGLTITLMATPAQPKPGARVVFTATAYASHAPGAIVYQLLYGDGTRAPQTAVPLFCATGKGAPVHRSWRFSHRYDTPDRYTASLTVAVNCSRDRASATVAVLVLRA